MIAKAAKAKADKTVTRGLWFIRTPLTRCRGCKKAVESWSIDEVWHESCYREHRKQEPECEAHRCCDREMKSRQETARAERLT